MGNLTCDADYAISLMLRAFMIVLVVRAVLSFIPSLNGRWAGIVFRLTDPVLQPVDRIVPPIAGFSIGFLIVFYLVQLGASFFANQAFLCQFGTRG